MYFPELTIEEARKLIGDIDISDEELAGTIEGLSGLVDVALDDFFDLEKDVK